MESAEEIAEYKRLIKEMQQQYIIRIEGKINDLTVRNNLQINGLEVFLFQYSNMYKCFFAQVKGDYRGNLSVSIITKSTAGFLWNEQKHISKKQRLIDKYIQQQKLKL